MLDLQTPDDVTRFARTAPCILVHVAQAKGSTPRVAGTCMLVNADATLGTIGGGHLEYAAIDAARQMLSKGERARSLALPLGPDLGQCCGGHITLDLEHLDDATCADLVAQATRARQAQRDVLIFGAGHVGRALALALHPLPLNTQLIDTRQGELARADPAITTHLCALPESAVRAARAGSLFVILTHDHALDFLLAREALARGDAAYVGMIGSQTKRATFTRWLEQETGSRDLCAGLTMPIGQSAVSDKRPSVIAAMVAAQLLSCVHAQAQQPRHEGACQ